jgi:hypothetical protein
MKDKVYSDQQMDSLIERLVPFYVKHINASIDWKQVLRDFKNPDYHEENIGCIKCSSYLGSVFTIMPSGKFWTWGASNVDQRDMIKDGAFIEALAHVVSHKNPFMMVESGEDDACDMFITIYVEDLSELDEMVL